jgi:hypothetical protein
MNVPLGVRLGALASVGVALGISVAAWSLHEQALVYADHGPPAPGHFYIDCQSGGPIDSSCSVAGPAHTVDVVFEDDTAPGTIGAFVFVIHNSEQPVIDAVSDGAEFTGNPDFNEATVGVSGDWACTGITSPSPEDDVGGPPGEEIHRLHCISLEGPSPPYAQSTPMVIASIDYTVGSIGFSTLAFLQGGLGDTGGIEIVNCDGVDGMIGTADDPCFGAVVNNPDTDGDLLADFADNCPSVANPGQENAGDPAIIDLSPHKPYDDVTLPQFPDFSGDACDVDADNDGLTDADEVAATTCGVATNPSDNDSDGDRLLDGAECTITLTNPAVINAGNPAVCHAAGDADNDKVLDSREACYYGTSGADPNSDTDARNDGCEVASINGDLVVNVIDLQQLSSEEQLYPGGNYPDPGSAVARDFDITKNGVLDVIDLQQVAAADMVCP